MNSKWVKEASEACSTGCCLSPLHGLPKTLSHSFKSIDNSSTFQYDFATLTASSVYPYTQFTNHESLPKLPEAFSSFTGAYPQYLQTVEADQVRFLDYYHLSRSKLVCLDYTGHGLFSYTQQRGPETSPDSIASTSSAPPQIQSHSSIRHGGKESGYESVLRRRIMQFLNVSEDDYSMVFTANETSAFTLVAEAYPFQTNQSLLTVYDHENEAVQAMIKSSKRKGAKPVSAEFQWPKMKISSKRVKQMVMGKQKNKGLFVFPLQSRVTGARYSYQWMSMAQENGWHVLLDASAIGAKDMGTLGLSIFQPDFLICNFYKVFGEDPSGFACLFFKKSHSSMVNESASDSSSRMVRIVPDEKPSLFQTMYTEQRSNQELRDESSLAFQQTDEDQSQQTHTVIEESMSTQSTIMATPDIGFKGLVHADSSGMIPLNNGTTYQEPQRTSISETFQRTTDGHSGNKNQKQQRHPEIEELISEHPHSKTISTPEIEFKGLDHADLLGIILIKNRARYLINWLVNALLKLKHPNSEHGHQLIKLYGPGVRFDRAPALAFNIFDWKGDRVDPVLVQQLAVKHRISLARGFITNLWFPDRYEAEKDRVLEQKMKRHVGMPRRKGKGDYDLGLSVVTGNLGLLTNFEDVYRVWAFASRFLDADFVAREKWRSAALNSENIQH